ncbi:hypothetical protein ACIBH1_22055 [Nonomuraea sp. NPDC050663]|uniref:hypothetical protein n=1 Tax=Nonomuraea sp. NPDC050663 TaxID=3364370 RepID=UPI0037A49A1F
MPIRLAVLALMLTLTPVPGQDTPVRTAVTAGAAQAVPGTSTTFSIEVSTGDGATGVVAAGALPDGTHFAGSDICQEQSPGLVCDFGDLDPGQNAAAVVELDLAPSFSADGLSLTMITSCDECGSPLPATGQLPVAPRADLALDLDGPAVIDAGGRATYTLTVANNGPSDSRDVRVQERIPAPLRALSPCACRLPVLAAGGQHTFQLVVTAPDDVGATREVTVSATAVAATPDPDPAGASTFVESEIRDDARLSLQVTTGAATITPGEPFHYVIEVSNQGPSPAREVWVRDLLPRGLRGDDAEDRRLGTLQAGESRTLRLTASADPALPAGSVADTVHAGCADCGKPVRVTSRTRVRPEAHVVVAVSARPARLGPGQQVIRTITVTNHGPSAATGLTLTDLAPAQLVLTPANGCELAAHLLTCPIHNLSVRQSRTWTLAATAPARIDHPATLVEHVRVILPATLFDPDPGTESATATTLLQPAPSRWPWILGGIAALLVAGTAVMIVMRRRRSGRMRA